jgi:hypothetical protein
MNPKWLITLFLLLVPMLTAKTRPAHPFFEELHHNFPGLNQLTFFISSENHASAFFTLTHWLGSHVDLTAYRSYLPPHLQTTITEMTECNLDHFSWTPIMQSDHSTLHRFLAVGDVMTSRYRHNDLSGTWAEKGWVYLLELIKTGLAEPHASHAQAALLKLAGQMNFFKDARKWQRKQLKIQKKLKKTNPTPSSPEAQILSR